MTDKKDVSIAVGRQESLVPKKRGSVLDAIRAGKTKPLAPVRPGRAALLAAAAAGTGRRPRMVFAIDATASREAAWSAAVLTTDALFSALPGQLDVALAVHGGSEVHTFTPFVPDAGALRDAAAAVGCRAGATCLVEVMARTRAESDVRVLVYIGDVFEEDEAAAYEAADALRLRGCRAVIFQDGDDRGSARVFAEIARRTGGAVLPFQAGATDSLRDILEAVGCLAAGGMRLLQQRQATLPGARLLLGHLPDVDRGS